MEEIFEFLVRASEDKALSEDFKSALNGAQSAADLARWFAANNVAISEDNVKIIFDNINNLSKIKGAIEVMSY